MRRAFPYLLALLLGVTAAMAVGCGDRSHLIPADEASTLKERLDAVRQAVDAGDCVAAREAVRSAKSHAQDLSTKVDRRLRNRINTGIRQLEATVPNDCQANQQTTETATTQAVPETPTTTQAPPTTTQVPTTTTAPPTDTTTAPTDTTTTPSDTVITQPDTGGSPGDGVPTP